MLGDLHPDIRMLSITLHQQELQAAVCTARLARQARQGRPLRRRLGQVLIAVGRALAGTPAEAAWTADGSPAPAQAVRLEDAAAPGTVTALTNGAPSRGHPDPAAELNEGAVRDQIAAWNRSVSCAEVVGAYVPLTPCAVGASGLCPWPAHHDANTEPAELVVYAAIGRWRCLATGESGTAFDFVRRMEGLPPAATLAVCRQRWPASLPRPVEPQPRREA